jgi:hypothetical protein
MSQLKSYEISIFQNGLALGQLDYFVRESNAVDGYEGLTSGGGLLIVLGDEIFDEELLDSIVLNHEPNQTLIFLDKTVAENRLFSEDLIQRFKKQNLISGLSTIDRAAWVHHRLRKVDYLLSDNETLIHIDVLNLVISGDIETAEQVLGQMSPDDMSEDYHWLNQERINWLRNEIRKYLEWPLL